MLFAIKACDDVYCLTPVINNESVNKNEITSIAQNSRNKIVSALLRSELEPSLGLSGTGQEVSIMRSTLLRTGIWNEDGGIPQINLHPQDPAMRNMMETIEGFVLEARQLGKVCFADLYERLTSPERHIGRRYQPRSFDMTFSMLGDRADYDRLVSVVVNQFAGQLCRVTLTEDPTLYALGTLEADPTYDPLTGKGTLVLSCTDGDAFLYYVEETVESISGSGTVTLRNDFMPIVPVITTTAETTLRRTVDRESFHKTVSAGTWEIPELEFRYGDNTVSVTGEGTTTFTYRQGRL